MVLQEKHSELIQILLWFTILLGINGILIQLTNNEHQFPLVNETSDLKFLTNLVKRAPSENAWILGLSLPLSLAVIYVVLQNDELAWNIRLFAAISFLFKALNAIFYELEYFCPHKQWENSNYQASTCVRLSSYSNDYISCWMNGFELMELAQCYQMMISISRFMIVSDFNKVKEKAQKWSFLQLFLPMIFYIPYRGVSSLLDQTSALINAWIVWIPYFLAVGLDIVLNKKIAKLKKEGKVSVAEARLMVQQRINARLTITVTIIGNIIYLALSLLFRIELSSVKDASDELRKNVFFCLIGGLISFFCLRKTKQQRVGFNVELNMEV